MAINSNDLFVYREGFVRLSKFIILLAVIILVLAGIFLYQVYNVRPQDRFFAVMNEGRTNVPLYGFRDPNINRAALESWAASVATDILTFSFDNLDERFRQNRHYFSAEGWESFSREMGRSRLLQSARDYQQIVTSIPLSNGTIIGQGWKSGTYRWMITVPVLMTIRAGDVSQVQRTNVQLIVIRMPTSENPNGVGIHTWINR